MQDYHINLFYSEEDEGYIADIPDLQFCSSFGNTPMEALQQLLKAKEAWIESAIMNNKTIPRPLYRPIIYNHVLTEDNNIQNSINTNIVQ
ncbi:Uncharacterized protein family UPF0150 domain protein [Candidatus Magnetomorum sp. HK-1]|nr:Uncharacterized protein family UPF0150 domain protein [Candidatus Magnetomorum sp. HK-1]